MKRLMFLSAALLAANFLFSADDKLTDLPVDENLTSYEEPSMPDTEVKNTDPFDVTGTAEELPVDPEFDDTGNTADAAAYEKEIQDLKVTDPEKEAAEQKKIKKALSICKKASELLEKGYFTEAKNKYKEALSINKYCTEAKQGIKDCDKASASEIAGFQDEAKTLYQEGRIYEASMKLKEAISKYPSDKNTAMILENMIPDMLKAADKMNKEAIISYQSNDLNKALEIWQKASELSPEDQNIRDYIARAKKKINAIQKLGGSK